MELIIHHPELLEWKDQYFIIEVLGGIKLSGLDRMKCTLKVTDQEQNSSYRSSLDLYHQDQTEKLIREVSDYFKRPVSETRKIIGVLTDQLENYRISFHKNSQISQAKVLTPLEEKKAILYLKQKELIKRLSRDIGRTGIVREEINRLLMYLVFTSRKLTSPMHIYTVGPTGTGKTHLQHHIASLIPEEDRLEMTSLSSHSLYYSSKEQLDHKLLCIEDLDGVAQEGMYMIRELQSSRKLTRTLAARELNGNMTTVRKTVEARVSIAATTTRESLYEDNANRAIIIHPDVSEKQSEAIMKYQKRKAASYLQEKDTTTLKEEMKNLQRVLKEIKVVNPFAESLTLPVTVSTPRRMMSIYLTLIETITFIHQCQREIKKNQEGEKYIETSKEDVLWANMLLKENFLTKSDDLSPAVRTCLERIKIEIPDKESFSSRQLREKWRIPSGTLTRYIKELVDKEYLRVEGNRYRGYLYYLRKDDFDTTKAIIDDFSNSVLQ